MNLSVVGSGPIRMPGKSFSSKYRMKVVLPVEYYENKQKYLVLNIDSGDAGLANKIIFEGKIVDLIPVRLKVS